MTPFTQTRRPGRPGIRRGTSLVEVLVAIILFSMVLVGASSSMLAAQSSMRDSRVFGQGTQILMHEMECMRLRPYSAASPGISRSPA